MTHQHQQYLEEDQSIYEQRKNDIDLYGYEKAFKKSRMSFEKYEYEKNNNRLRGEF